MSVLHFFLWMNNIPFYGYTRFYLSIHWLMDIWGFYLLVIMNNAAMNIQVFVWTYVFISLGCIPRSGIAGSYGDSVLPF